MMDRNNIIMIIFNLVLAATICLLLLAINVYPGLKVFFVTTIIACIFVLLLGLYKLYQKGRDRAKLERKQQKNIIPGQCPDYWTRSINGDKLICKNEFVTMGANNEPVKYSFTGKLVPKTIILNDVASLANAKKCDSFGSALAFGAPWVEMQQKCRVLNIAYDTTD
jgi:hypothetical protein